MESENIELGLREIRKATGYTSEQLGQDVGMNPTYITRVENGTIKSPSFATIMRLAEVLSKSDKIVNNEVNLAEYSGLFPKLIMVLKNQDVIVDKYSQSKALTNLNDMFSSIDFLSENELSVFNNYAKYKKHFSYVERYSEQFKQQYLNIDKKNNAIDSFEFTTFLKLMITRIEEAELCEINRAFVELLSSNTIESYTSFMKALFEPMQTFIPQFENASIEESNKKYLSSTEKNLLFNEQSE